MRAVALIELWYLGAGLVVARWSWRMVKEDKPEWVRSLPRAKAAWTWALATLLWPWPVVSWLHGYLHGHRTRKNRPLPRPRGRR